MLKWLFTKWPLCIVINLPLGHKNQLKDLDLKKLTKTQKKFYLFFIIIYSSTVNMSVTSLHPFRSQNNHTLRSGFYNSNRKKRREIYEWRHARKLFLTTILFIRIENRFFFFFFLFIKILLISAFGNFVLKIGILGFKYFCKMFWKQLNIRQICFQNFIFYTSARYGD